MGACVELALDHARRTKSTSRFSTWPTGAFHLDKLPRKVTKAYLLADSAHTPLKMTQTGDALDLQLPAKAPDAIASVLVLETK